MSSGKKLQLDSAQFQLAAIKQVSNTKAVDELPESEFLTINEFKQREKENIIAALQYCKWRVSGEGGAADLLGIKPTTLAHQMKKFQIKRPS